ncbi:MAG: acyltransferase [Polyangiales bacterium]|nr:acyltransferase [Sandaracinaceae bacterium]
MSNAAPPPGPRSHGSGEFAPEDLAACGEGCVFEAGVLVFHPENVRIGARVYVGHQTILKGYYKSTMVIGDGTWIGQQCFFHSAGGLRVGRNVGIGPGVRVITSNHQEAGRDVPILHAPLAFAEVVIEDDADLGVGTIVLPGVTIGRGAQIGAGAVVTEDVPPYAVAVGVPARVVRVRP